MLLPREESLSRLRFRKKRESGLRRRAVAAQGKASVLTMRNRAFSTPRTNRRSTAWRPRSTWRCSIRRPSVRAARRTGRAPEYAGRRLFGAGINLTHLYQGKSLSLVRSATWVRQQDLPGSPRPTFSEEKTLEKLWNRGGGGLAIGGHLPGLLTMDYTLAAHDAYLTCRRARKAHSGAANLRLPRFVGDVSARQA